MCLELYTTSLVVELVPVYFRKLQLLDNNNSNNLIRGAKGIGHHLTLANIIRTLKKQHFYINK